MKGSTGHYDIPSLYFFRYLRYHMHAHGDRRAKSKFKQKGSDPMKNIKLTNLIAAAAIIIAGFAFTNGTVQATSAALAQKFSIQETSQAGDPVTNVISHSTHHNALY